MKKHVKCIMALVLTFALVLAIPFAFTQEASAASKKAKKTTMYLTTQMTNTSKDENGKTKKMVKKYTYNSKGFMTKETWKEGKDNGKTLYKYNKKGYVKSVKSYSKGKLESKTTVKMNKNGMPAVVKTYQVKGKKKHTYTYNFVYSGKELIKINYKDIQEKKSGTINLKGEPAPSESAETEVVTDNTNNVKYDKKGRIIEETYSDTFSEVNDQGVTETTVFSNVWKYTYNKAGKITKEKVNTTSTLTYSDGTAAKTVKTSDTYTYKYKKKKLAKNYDAIELINLYVKYL